MQEQIRQHDKDIEELKVSLKKHEENLKKQERSLREEMKLQEKCLRMQIGRLLTDTEKRFLGQPTDNVADETLQTSGAWEEFEVWRERQRSRQR